MKTPKILTIDDDKSFNRLVSTILTNSGFEVVTTETPEDFLKSLKNDKPDACLVDLNLGVAFGAGFQLIQAIRNKFCSEIPIIVISKRNSSNDIGYAIEIGATDYLTKPVDDVLLLSKLQMHISDLIEIPKEKNFYPISMNNSASVLSLDFELLKVDEFGLYLRTPHLILKGTWIEIGHPLLSQITGKDKAINFRVENNQMDPNDHHFLISLLFDPDDEKLIAHVRNWISLQNNL